MEKQNKVVNKIKNSLKHGNEGQLGTKNNDECYTSMQDIMNELSYWGALGKFKGKNIICPCDWDIVDGEDIYGITINYENDDIDLTCNNVYKTVKEVFVDLWSTEETVSEPTKHTISKDEIEDFLREKLTCNFIRTLTQNAKRWGIKSITASGYNPANNKGTPFQDVDYSKYDVCITNPPFSLYKDFMKSVIGKIDFIILAPFMNRVAPTCGLPLMLKQAYLGVGVHLPLSFINPTKENAYHTKSVACDWLVTWPEAQQERNNKHYKSGVQYETYKDEYIEITSLTMKDGTHPIRVPSQFPEDYNGWMFGGINILDKLDQDAYEWYGTHFDKYYNDSKGVDSPFAGEYYTKANLKLDDKLLFGGIVFKKKQVEE